MDSTVTRYQVIEMTILVSSDASCVPMCYVSYGALFPVSGMTRNIFQTEPGKSFDVMYQLLIYFSEVLRM
jgi:hypothetical protein